MTQNYKIALAHDSLTQMGGAERVLEGLHELYPEAPLFTLVEDKKLTSSFVTWDIRTSWLQKFYNFIPLLRYWIFLVPMAVRSLNFRGYNIVFSSSSGFIKNIKVPKNTIHINYCHTPARFLWLNEKYVGQEMFGWRALGKPLIKIFIQWMKIWDYAGAQRVDYFIANSREVQTRIKKYYQRDSEIIRPFVDTNFWQPTRSKQNYFLIAGRLHAHKDNELIIKIFNELGWPLHVVGAGRQEMYLRKIAKANIIFLGRVDDATLRDEYSGARGFIYPQEEDFGLMPVEAAACGTATLGLARGGSLETIIPGLSGELFAAAEEDAVKDKIKIWNYEKYQVDFLRSHAEKFSKKIFEQKITEFLKNLMRNGHHLATPLGSTHRGAISPNFGESNNE